LIEQAALIALPPSHHHRSPSPKLDQMKESVFAEALKPFFDSIDPKRTKRSRRRKRSLIGTQLGKRYVLASPMRPLAVLPRHRCHED
ncbi:hypothetical protein, partial [Rhodopseudomonas palustris]|uniref:hypothetical protein n=1 Tax=Rhodopseudomonas palustris TaxID=1076 RepID=UPI001958E220